MEFLFWLYFLALKKSERDTVALRMDNGVLLLFQTTRGEFLYRSVQI